MSNIHSIPTRINPTARLSAPRGFRIACMDRSCRLPAPRTPKTAPAASDSSDSSPPSVALSTQVCSRPTPRLARREPERCDPPHHRPEKPPRQMTLRQQQPVVARVLDQPAAGDAIGPLCQENSERREPRATLSHMCKRRYTIHHQDACRDCGLARRVPLPSAREIDAPRGICSILRLFRPALVIEPPAEFLASRRV